MAHSPTSPEYHTVVRKVLLFPESASPARWYRKPELTCNSGNHLTLVVSHLQRGQVASHHQTQYHHNMLITHHTRTYFIQAVRLYYLTVTQVHERLPMTNNSISCSKAAGMEARRADAITSTITRWIRCLTRLPCACRSVWSAADCRRTSCAHDPACVTPLTRLVTQMLCVRVTMHGACP